MTREQKDLLIKDLSARLSYGVKIRVEYPFLEEKDWRPENFYGLDLRREVHAGTSVRIEEFKPYLFPLSSMTDKDLIEFLQINGMNLNSDELKTFRRGQTTIVSTLSSYSRRIDWLNAHHFDYRGLIEKGLAIDATGLNIY